MSAWGVRKGYLTRPWLDPTTTELTREKMARRHRRLDAREEARLMEVAPPRLQRLIVAALETGCRSGELLSLLWADVDLARGEIRLRAENTKDRDYRTIPISARVRAVLEMARTDPAGREFPPDAHVFGDETGRAMGFKKAWITAVLKAHGHKPVWTASNGLAAESRATLDAIDLCFHDLRHEAASRWLEAGVPIHHIQELLGHADVKTTSIYLNATGRGLHESIKVFDRVRLERERLAKRSKKKANTGLVERQTGRQPAPTVAPKPLVN